MCMPKVDTEFSSTPMWSFFVFLPLLLLSLYTDTHIVEQFSSFSRKTIYRRTMPDKLLTGYNLWGQRKKKSCREAQLILRFTANLRAIPSACVLFEARPFIVPTDLCRQTRQWRPIWFDIPHSQKLGLFSRGWSFCLHLQAVNMSYGDHSSSNIPGQAHEGAYDHQDGHPEQIQMVTSTFLWRETENLCFNFSK